MAIVFDSKSAVLEILNELPIGRTSLVRFIRSNGSNQNWIIDHIINVLTSCYIIRETGKTYTVDEMETKSYEKVYGPSILTEFFLEHELDTFDSVKSYDDLFDLGFWMVHSKTLRQEAIKIATKVIGEVDSITAILFFSEETKKNEI